MASDRLADVEQPAQRSNGNKEGWKSFGGIGLIFIALAVLFYGGVRGLQAQGKMAVEVANDNADGQVADKDPTQQGPLEVASIADKPQSDARNYGTALLPNGLLAVAVQDNRSHFTAFSVAVMVGSYDDPLELPGLSHFCEHMLFLGTERFPNPTGFDDFVNMHGGSFNAFTASEVTDYFFQVPAIVTKEAASRFSDFFRAPLFNNTFVEKEVRAVNSEHEKNVQDSSRRVYATMQSLANAGSVVRKFATGDVNTLNVEPKKKGIDPMQALKAHFKKHYCPSRMRLVSFGPASPEEQLRLASDTFGGIQPREKECSAQPPVRSQPPAWPASALGKWVDVLGTSPTSNLLVQFALPAVGTEWKSQPLNYLAWGLVFKGPGSPFEVLRDRLGLIQDLGVGVDSDSTGSSVSLQLHLTEAGRDSPELVLDVLFAYLASFRRHGLDEEVYLSINNKDKLDWTWQEPGDPMTVVQTLSERLTRVPAEDVLWADQVARTMAPKRAMELVSLLTPAQANMAFVDPRPLEAGQQRGSVPASQEVLTLPHYGVKHSVRPLGAVFSGALARWEAWAGDGNEQTKGLNDEELRAALKQRLNEGGVTGFKDALATPPGKIMGLPSKVTLANADGSIKHEAGAEDAKGEKQLHLDQVSSSMAQSLFGAAPARLATKEGDAEVFAGSSEVLFRQGWTSNPPVFSPTASVQVLLRTPKAPAGEEVSARDQVRMSLYAALLGEEMDTLLADVSAAGGHYTVVPSTSSLALSFTALAPMLNVTVTRVMTELGKHVQLPNANRRFPRLTSALRKQLSSHEAMPITYAIADRNLLLTSGMRSSEELLAALDQVDTAAASQALTDLVLKKPLQLTALTMGNMDEQQARDVVTAAAHGVSSASGKLGATSEVDKLTPIVGLKQPVELRKKNPRANDPNDVTVVSLVSGLATVESRVHLGLLGELLGNVAFEELRTAMQLGYVANGGMVALSNVLMLSVVVQGTKKNADDMEAAVQHAYTKTMPKTLAALTDASVQELKAAFRDKLLEPPMHTASELSHFWGIASTTGSACFGLVDEAVGYLNNSVSKASLVRTYNQLVFPTTGVRRKLVVKYFAGDAPPPRPSAAEAEKAWVEQGVSSPALPLLRREYEQTLLLDTADAASRAQLLARSDGEYFPPTVHCKRQTPQTRRRPLAGAVAAGAAAVQVEAQLHEQQPELLAQLLQRPPPAFARNGRVYKGWRQLQPDGAMAVQSPEELAP